MTQNLPRSPEAATLRHRAEARWQERRTVASRSLTEAETQRLIHELQIHQIELELQNEELRETRNRLDQNPEKYADLYDLAPMGYFVLAGDGTIQEVNLAGAALFEVERSRLLQQRFGIFVSVETRPTFNAFLDAVLTGASGASCEITLEGTTPRHLHLAGIALESNAGQLCRVAVVDLTANRRASETLPVYQQIVDSSPDSMALVGTDYRYRIINDTYLRRTGLTREQIVGHNVAAIMGQAVFDEIVKPRLDRCLAGATVNYAEWFDFPTQGRRYMEVTYFPCRDRNAAIVGAVAIARDATERKRAEEKLRTTLQQLDALTASLYASVLLVREDGRVAFANQAFCDLFELTETPDRLRGLTSSEMLQKIQKAYASPSEALARIQDIVARGQPVKGEEVTLQDGRLLIRDFIPIAIDGQRHGRLWHHVDITERRQLEAALRDLNRHLEQRVGERTAELTRTVVLLNHEMQARQRGEERLTQALSAARAGAWEWNTATDQAIWSDENYRVLGLIPGSVEACHENWLRCMHPDDRAQAERQMARAVEQGSELNSEFRVVWPDGGIRWVNSVGKLRLDPAGNPVGMYGIQIDITERKRAETAFRETEALYHQLVENQPDLICQFLPDTTLTFVNAAYARFFGRQPVELLGQRFIEFLSEEEQVGFWEQLMTFTPAAAARQHERRTIRADGVACWHLWHDFALFDQQGQITGFQSVGVDITERIQVETELRASETRLKEAQQLAHIGHWELDLIHDSLSWSDEIFRIFEIDSQRFGARYQDFLDIVHPEDLDLVHRSYTESVARRTPYHIDHACFSRTGASSMCTSSARLTTMPKASPFARLARCRTSPSTSGPSMRCSKPWRC